MLAGHGILGPCLGHLDKIDKASLTLFETADNGFLRELWEIFVLDDEIMKIVSEVIGTGSPTVAVEHAKETDLGPLNIQVLLAFGLQDVEDD